MAPLASAVPVATTQVPGTASVSVPVPLWSTDVLESNVTVALPFCCATVSLPLATWLTWPLTAFANAPRPGLGDVLAAAPEAPAGLPMLPQPASTAAATPTTMMLALTTPGTTPAGDERLPAAVKNL